MISNTEERQTNHRLDLRKIGGEMHFLIVLDCCPLIMCYAFVVPSCPLTVLRLMAGLWWIGSDLRNIENLVSKNSSTYQRIQLHRYGIRRLKCTERRKCPGVEYCNYIYYSQIYLLTTDYGQHLQITIKKEAMRCDAMPVKLSEIKHDSIIYNRTENR